MMKHIAEILKIKNQLETIEKSDGVPDLTLIEAKLKQIRADLIKEIEEIMDERSES